MKNTVKIFAFALVAIVVTACSKYEEGPSFTLLSKRARMENTWVLTSYTLNDVNSPIIGTYTMKLEKNGNASITTSFGTEEGQWEFSDDKESLILTGVNNNTDTYEILMLKSKDLKLKQVNGSITEVSTFEGE